MIINRNRFNFDCFPLLTDSYKLTHWKQYPPNTGWIYSYFSARAGKFPETVFTGLQPILMKYLVGQVVNASMVKDAADLAALHFGQDLFNHAGWEHIVRDHDGHLPLEIKAVPEGTVVPIHNVLMTVENTCSKCFWLTNFVETLLVQAWYPCTVATISRTAKQIILKYLKATGCDPAAANFMLHDFGFRGVSSVESAILGGMAHLNNFLGTDTLAAIWGAKTFYDEPCAGFSIPASEHSTITSWGRDKEYDAFANMLSQFPTGYVACVSDSYDVFKACSDGWGRVLHDVISNRDGKLVVRPDSGNPREVVLQILTILGEKFGVTYNDKGFKLLNPKVSIIQGDGVNLDSIADILREMQAYGWAASNIAFGMGGALLQKLDRDVQSMAFKCAEAKGLNYDEEGKPTWPWVRAVSKDPITDKGKASIAGRMKLVRKTGGGLYTQPASLSASEEDVLIPVFRDGELLVKHTFAEVRERAKL